MTLEMAFSQGSIGAVASVPSDDVRQLHAEELRAG